jgi:3-oxoadipate enol-lactonase
MKPPLLLLLLHGYPLDSSMWDGQSALGAICPDLPGFGESKKSAPETIEGFAKEVKAFLDENNIEKVILAGFSMGGYITFAFYEMFPELVEGLIFIDTKASADTEEDRAGRDGAIKSLASEGVQFFAENMPQKLLSKEGLKNETLVNRVREIILRQQPDSIKNALIAMRDRKDRSFLLSKIVVPALFICGEKDVLTPPSEMKSMSEKVRGSSFALIKSVGHVSNMENPKDFNLAVDKFLNDHWGG